MPTSTNMQSCTHLLLLVGAVVMAVRVKPLPHPSLPPTKDVVQSKKEKKVFKAKYRPVQALSRREKRLTCLDQIAFFRSGNLPLLGMLVLLLLHDSRQFRWEVQ